MTLNAVGLKPPPIYGDGAQVPEWIHVSDNCAAIETVLGRGTPGKIYNIGGGAGMPNIDITRRLCKIVAALRPGPTKRDSLITSAGPRLPLCARYGQDRRGTRLAAHRRNRRRTGPNCALESGKRRLAAAHPGRQLPQRTIGSRGPGARVRRPWHARESFSPAAREAVFIH